MPLKGKLHISLEPCGFKFWPRLCRDAVLSLAAKQAGSGGPPCRFSSAVQRDPQSKQRDAGLRGAKCVPQSAPESAPRQGKKERRQPNKKHSLCTLKGAHHPNMRSETYVFETDQPNKKHSLCTLKGAHHPKMRNAVPIVFPRHVDNVDDTSGRKKYYGRRKASKQETKRETQKEEHERQNTRTNANREPIPP